MITTEQQRKAERWGYERRMESLGFVIGTGCDQPLGVIESIQGEAEFLMEDTEYVAILPEESELREPKTVWLVRGDYVVATIKDYEWDPEEKMYYGKSTYDGKRYCFWAVADGFSNSFREC